ncbi:MAG: pyrimidine 5'-nucleotidase [Chloroflexi bacterium]|nr:pyrimidine 5'-nucleotidase [Chloroflexota bacterium]
MKIHTIFFDLDDTLYPSSAGLWPAIKERMNRYMHERLDIPEPQIPALRERYFQDYGTTLRGLQAHYAIDTRDYLAYVHDLPLDRYLVPNPSQRNVIASLPTRNLVFTNSDESHARRVRRSHSFGMEFADIVDINSISPYCKPMPESFEIAMRIAGEAQPERCVMIDDLPHTTRAARQYGMSSLLYGGEAVDGAADSSFSEWSELPGLLERL